jgi:hypothetical protein
MQGLVIGRYIFTDTSKRERGGALFFRVMAKQGHKISYLKILNYTSPPSLINYDQSLIVICQPAKYKQGKDSQGFILYIIVTIR